MRKKMALLVLVSLLAVLMAWPAAADETHAFTVVLAEQQVTPEALAAVAAAGGEVTARLDAIGVLQVRTAAPEAFIKAVMGSPAILSVAPDMPLEGHMPGAADAATTAQSTASLVENLLPLRWNVARVTNNGEAWSLQAGSKDVVVAVIDSGIDFDHPDLQGSILPGSRTFVPGTADARDQLGHGTMVAGFIAANGQMLGVAPKVGIRAYRVMGTAWQTNTYRIADAIVAAADDGADVINLSIFQWIVKGQMYYVNLTTGERTPMGDDSALYLAYRRAVEYAVGKGAVVVAAAGNWGADISSPNKLTRTTNDLLQYYYKGIYEAQGATNIVPSSIPGVVMVSGTGGGYGTPDRFTSYSNYGNGAVDLGAPGGDMGPAPGDPEWIKYQLWSTWPAALPCPEAARAAFGDCRYNFGQGTSYATPHVSGAAALLIAQEYARTGAKPAPSQVITRLQQSSDDAGKIGHDPYFGHGLVNAYRALSGK